MASQKSYIMDPVHRYFSDPMFSNHVKPPDKYNMTFMAVIMWFLFSISFYNKDSIQNYVTEGHLKVPNDGVPFLYDIIMPQLNYRYHQLFLNFAVL